MLFTGAAILPIRRVLDMKSHVASKDQLSWRLLQRGIVARIAKAVALEDAVSMDHLHKGNCLTGSNVRVLFPIVW